MISGGAPSRFSSPSTNTTTKHADAAALSSSSTSTRFSLPRSSIMPKRLIPPSTRPLHSTSPERAQQQAPPPTTRPLHSSSPNRKLVPSPPRVTHQQLRQSGGTPTHSSAVIALSPREHVHHQHPYALELRRYHAGRIFEAKVFQNEDHNSDVVKRIAASNNDSGGAAVAFVLDFLIGGINYAHLEAACTSPQHTGLNPHRLEDIIGGELLGLLHRTNLFSRDHRITFDVRLQAGAVNALSLQVEDEVNATISNVRIIGGEWPAHVRVTAHAADADDMRRVHLHFDPVLRHWLAASPFQDSLLFIKSLLGPEVRARPTITDVRLDGRLLFHPDNGEMVRQPDAAALSAPHVEKADAMTSPFVPAITFNGAGPSRSPSHRSATTIADNNNHIVTSRSVSRSIMADINTDEPSSTRREVVMPAITHSDPRKAYLSDSDDEIRTPKVRRVAQHQQQQPHHSHQEVHHFLSSQQTISSTVSVDLPQPSSRPRLATTQQRKSIFSLASPPRSSLSPDLSRPLSPPITAASTHSSARGSPTRHISTPSPSRRGSPTRGRSAGSLLLRVSTSPMRSEDYYVVGGVQLSHVDVTVRVPVQVRSWRVCDICETKLRNLLLSHREMLEYYARDDLYELLSKASRDPTYGGSPRSAQALLNCARHVMVSLDVVSAADPIDANEQSDSLITIGSSHHHHQQQQDGGTAAARDLSPSVTILFVCSILCENLVEKLLVSELWSSVERERLLLHATQGTLMFRRLLKEVVAMIATGDPVSGGTADGLVSLVTSVPASLKGCQLSIGGKIAWTGLSTAVGGAAAPVRVSQPPHEYHDGEYHSRNVASSPQQHHHYQRSPSSQRSPELMVHPVLSDGYRSVSATSEHPAQPLLTHRLTNEDLVFHDEDPAPMPHQFLSTSPTPLRSPPSLEGSNVVTLVLVFSQMPLQPLQNAMRWWAASTKQAHVVGLGTHSSSNPADQLIRACQFDLLDGLQEFCFEPEDCAVRVVASTPQDRFKFTAPLFGLSSPQNSSSHGKADSNSTKKSPALRLVAKVRASSHFASSNESYAKFQAAILAYCKTTNQFAALRDVYSQLYFMTIDEEQQRGDAVTPRSRTPPPHIVFPFLDAEESTFNGIPIRNMMQPTHPQQSLPSRHSFVF